MFNATPSYPDGSDAGAVVEKDHHRWYQEMFAPSVMADIVN